MKAEIAKSSRSAGCSGSARSADESASCASLQARLAYASRPRSRSPAGMPDSDPEETPQRQAGAERADGEAAKHEHRGSPRERKRAHVGVVLDVAEDLRD